MKKASTDMALFILPKEIHYGRGTIEKLRLLSGERAVLVFGGLKQGTGLIDAVKSFLTQKGMNVRLLNEANAATQAQSIKNGAKAMREFRPDWILAIGDGMTISAAKAMWILYEHAWMQLEHISEEKSYPLLRRQANLAVLPAGFGMAADASSQCVVQDESIQLRLSRRNKTLTPDLTILDPFLMENIPFAISAYNGLDALSYALEALLSPNAAQMTDACANQAACELFKSLPLCFTGNKDAQEKVYYAEFLAGAAFANTGFGLINELTFKLISLLCQYHLPRGCISSILLPLFIRENRIKQERLGGVLALLGIKAYEDHFAEETAEMITRLAFLGGVPGSFSALGIREKDYMQTLPYLETIIKAYVRDIPLFSPDSDKIKSLLSRAYSGSK